MYLVTSHMENNKSKNQLVSSYHTSIILVFFILVIIAFSLAGVKYFSELEHYKKDQFQQLNEETSLLNSILSQSVNALAGMRDFANYYLDNPEELKASLPRLLQDNDNFYLEKATHDILNYRQPLNVNITGIGQLSSLSVAVKQELTMAHALAPAFITAEKSNAEANWLYYTSFSKFISVYPWISRDTWQFSARTLNNSHMQRIIHAKKSEKKFYWSIPYEDAADKGLNTAVGAAVFRGEKIAGAVFIDINLGKIHDRLTPIEYPDHGLVLLDNNDKILVHRTKEDQKIKSNFNKHSNLPPELAQLTYSALHDDNQGHRVGDYFVQFMHVPVNNWVVLRYQPYSDVISKVTSEFISSLVLSLIALLALLTIIYAVTRRTFIKPTQQFIAHIEHSAKGDHGKIQTPKGWAHWFYLVEDIFSQNRSLLQQLKDQNKELDIRVNEKTHALREKSEQHQYDYAILRSVMDAIPDYLIFNNLQHNIIGCNLAFERLIGMSEGEMLGSNAGELLPNELGKVLTKNALENGENKGKLNIVETLSNTYEVFIEAFFNTEKELLGTIVIIRDVTEKTAVTTALEQAKIQAEQANSAKSQFLANMSHEIRTPINAIQGMHFLLTQSGLASSQKVHLDNAQVASTALLHLVDELLDLAKIESGNMSIVKASSSIDRIVNQAIKLNVGNAFHKGLNVNVDIKTNVPHFVVTDEMRLVQVLSNLLHNAVKFTKQGAVSIIVESTASETSNALVKFTVRDTGIGIAKDKQAFLFEAFRQADESMTRQYGGSGLGLSICRQIINLLDGDITIVSDVDQGAEFSFVLPLKTDQATTSLLSHQNAFTFVDITESLPDSFIENIKGIQQSYVKFDSLLALENITKVNANGSFMVFLDAGKLNRIECNSVKNLYANDEVDIVLFVLCQNSYKDQNQSLLNWFDEQLLPYVVCEQPIYRYGLLQIFEALSHEVSRSAKANNLTEKDQATLIPSNDKTNLTDLTILLVEDNLVNQLVAKELLNSMGAEVVIAENGQIALDIISGEQKIDIILMDIQMPIMDGLTAAREIRKQSKHSKTPIIAMTAHAREDDKRQSFEAGMNLHIAKPVNADTLKTSILSLLESE